MTRGISVVHRFLVGHSLISALTCLSRERDGLFCRTCLALGCCVLRVLLVERAVSEIPSCLACLQLSKLVGASSCSCGGVVCQGERRTQASLLWVVRRIACEGVVCLESVTCSICIVSPHAGPCKRGGRITAAYDTGSYRRTFPPAQAVQCCARGCPSGLHLCHLVYHRAGFAVALVISVATTLACSGFRITPRGRESPDSSCCSWGAMVLKAWARSLTATGTNRLTNMRARIWQGEGITIAWPDDVVDHPMGVGLNNWSYWVTTNTAQLCMDYIPMRELDRNRIDGLSWASGLWDTHSWLDVGVN